LEHLFTSTVVYSVALTLIHFLWQGLLVSCVLKLALLLTPCNKPQWRYVLASMAMTANFVIPLVTFFIVYQSAQIPAQSSQAITAFNDLTATSLHSISQHWSIDLTTLLPYVSIIWLVLVSCLACKMLIEMCLVSRLPKRAVMPADPALLTRFNQLLQQMKLPSKVQLLIAVNIDVPMAIGWLKPVVLLPATMVSGLTPAQLEMLLLHELAHIRRYDYLVNFMQTLVEILLFFHPGVQWVSSQMRHEREHCSDDIAVQYCGDPVAYARTLADTATLFHQHQPVVSPMVMAASGGDLKQRVVRLVGHHYSSVNKRNKGYAITTIITAMALYGAQQFLNLSTIPAPFPSILGIDATDPLLFMTQETSLVQHDQGTTSIARQLLKPSSAKTKAYAALAPKIVNRTMSFQSTTEELNTPTKTVNIIRQVPQIITRAAIEDTRNNNSNNNLNSNLTLDKSQNSNQKQRSEPARPAQVFGQSLALNKVDQNPLTTQMIEASNAPTAISSNDNPYAIQVAELAKEYHTNDYPLEQRTMPNNTSAQYALAAQHKTSNLSPRDSQFYSAKLLSSIEPKYPAKAKRRGLELEVKINFTIDVDGKIKDIQFPLHAKTSYFKRSIRQALNKWSFLPANLNGNPVKSQMSKIFSFSLI
jgi:bla regulator protein BlaR1